MCKRGRGILYGAGKNWEEEIGWNRIFSEQHNGTKFTVAINYSCMQNHVINQPLSSNFLIVCIPRVILANYKGPVLLLCEVQQPV